MGWGLRERPFGLGVVSAMNSAQESSVRCDAATSGAALTIRRQWPLFRDAGWRMHRYSVIAAGAHYGGNIINAFATDALTAAVSWPLGTTSQLWTYVWGLATGEFKGAPRKSYLLIAAGGALYAVGILYLRWALLRQP